MAWSCPWLRYIGLPCAPGEETSGTPALACSLHRDSWVLAERVIKQEQRWSSLLPPALWMGQRRSLWAPRSSLAVPMQCTSVQQGLSSSSLQQRQLQCPCCLKIMFDVYLHMEAEALLAWKTKSGHLQEKWASEQGALGWLHLYLP